MAHLFIQAVIAVARDDLLAARRAAAVYDPVMTIFDTAFYMAANEDVARSVALGEHVSAYEHFTATGRAEGRAPCA